MIDWLESIPFEARMTGFSIICSCLFSIFLIEIWSWKESARREKIRRFELELCRLVGKSRKEVAVILGEPDDKSEIVKYAAPSIFTYGHYEIHFGPRNKDPALMIFNRGKKVKLD